MIGERGERGTWHSMGFWSGGELDLPATLAQLPADDMYAARVVSEQLWPGELHHATEAGRWFVWDGRCHRPDDSALIDRRVNCFAGWCEAVLHVARQEVARQVTARMP